MDTEIQKYKGNDRTEEVQDIIERMPNRFGFWVTLIVLGIFILLLVFGWFIRYPDVVTGQININATEAPVKLVANSYGKLRLNGLKSMAEVKENQIIGYLQNPADLTSITKLDNILKSFNPNANDFTALMAKLPKDLSFGEINAKYSVFLNSVNELNNYNVDKLFDKQSQNLISLLNEQKNAMATSVKRIDMNSRNLLSMGKFYRRDSILFSKKVISESELDKTEMSFNTSKDNYQGAVSALINNKQQAQQTEGKLKEIAIQKSEKQKELRIAVIATYNDLVDNIKSWELKYVFRAPFAGKVQFLKFWVDNQFIQSGDQVFTIVPKMNKVFGEVSVPTVGAGKVKVGQEVIVKLDNFPYYEYGSIKGVVNSISLSTNTVKTQEGDKENYMVTVKFPNQLATNYGAKLDVKLDAKGSAEIITNDRRLIERFFDNLKYAVRK
ncbi:MAG: HlyD family efflux transporter periplasmic adaptor subunit [Bacteroidota bacterium]